MRDGTPGKPNHPKAGKAGVRPEAGAAPKKRSREPTLLGMPVGRKGADDTTASGSWEDDFTDPGPSEEGWDATAGGLPSVAADPMPTPAVGTRPAGYRSPHDITEDASASAQHPTSDRPPKRPSDRPAAESRREGESRPSFAAKQAATSSSSGRIGAVPDRGGTKPTALPEARPGGEPRPAAATPSPVPPKRKVDDAPPDPFAGPPTVEERIDAFAATEISVDGEAPKRNGARSSSAPPAAKPRSSPPPRINGVSSKSIDRPEGSKPVARPEGSKPVARPEGSKSMERPDGKKRPSTRPSSGSSPRSPGRREERNSSRPRFDLKKEEAREEVAAKKDARPSRPPSPSSPPPSKPPSIAPKPANGAAAKPSTPPPKSASTPGMAKPTNAERPSAPPSAKSASSASQPASRPPSKLTAPAGLPPRAAALRESNNKALGTSSPGVPAIAGAVTQPPRTTPAIATASTLPPRTTPAIASASTLPPKPAPPAARPTSTIPPKPVGSTTFPPTPFDAVGKNGPPSATISTSGIEVLPDSNDEPSDPNRPANLARRKPRGEAPPPPIGPTTIPPPVAPVATAEPVLETPPVVLAPPLGEEPVEGSSPRVPYAGLGEAFEAEEEAELREAKRRERARTAASLLLIAPALLVGLIVILGLAWAFSSKDDDAVPAPPPVLPTAAHLGEPAANAANPATSPAAAAPTTPSVPSVPTAPVLPTEVAPNPAAPEEVVVAPEQPEAPAEAAPTAMPEIELPDVPASVRRLTTARRDREARRRLTLGSRLLRRRQFERAESTFRDGLVYDPDSSDLAHAMAIVSLRQDNNELASAWASRSTELDPEDSDHFTLLGDIYSQMGQRPAAQAAWEHALEINPRDRTARRRLHR